MLAPGSTRIPSKDDDGYRITSTWSLLKIWEKKSCSSPCMLSRPVQTMGKQHSGGLVALLCLDKAGQSPQVPISQENLSDILGLAAKDRCYPGNSAHNDLEEIWGSSLYLA